MELREVRKVDGKYYRFERGTCDECCCLYDEEKCAYIASELEDCEGGCFKEYTDIELFKTLMLEDLKSLEPSKFVEKLKASASDVKSLISSRIR